MLKYVRVWGIPPDAPDGDVARFFGNYGDVKRVVHERYPRDLNCPIETGVRGIHMDLRQELPHFKHIRNFGSKFTMRDKRNAVLAAAQLSTSGRIVPRSPSRLHRGWPHMANLNSLLRDTGTPVTSVTPAPLAKPMPVTPAITFANIASATHEVEIVSQTIAAPAPIPPPESPKIRRPATRQSRSRGGPRSSPPIRDRSRRSGGSSSGSRVRPGRPSN
jgi:hypothetical protein